ncbi:MAG: Fe2+-dependent dioxygenase [Thiolinea sp.]
MLIHLKAVLDIPRLREVRSLLDNGEFVNGSLSAGKEAKKAKHNEELSPNSPLRRRLDAIVMPALIQHPEYQAFAMPLKVATAFYVRYQPGMGYGFHVDDPVMGPMSGRYRSDISTTVFLNSPDEYQGGELVIRTPLGEQVIKGDAGDAVVYSSGSWHQVNPVTEGVRLAAVTWAQSLVKSPEQRELLYQLAQAREGLMEKMPESDEAVQLSTAYSNLLRMWSDV